MKHSLLITIMVLSFKTYAQVEARLPFSNIDYNSMSLRPLNLLDTDFAIRFYINNGGSMDRIITLRADSIKRSSTDPDSVTDVILQGTIQMIGLLYYPENDSSIFYYNEKSLDIKIVRHAIETINSLNLWQVQSRKEVLVKMHEPNSLYTIELKNRQDYHTFYFYTLYPTETETDTIYGKLQESIFSLFPIIKEQIIKI